MLKIFSVSFLVLAVILAALQTTEACSCVPHKPTDPPVYCSTDFLALVTIVEIKSFDSLHWYYGFKLIKDISSARGHVSLNLTTTGIIRTNKDSAACGVNLQEGTYLLGGFIESTGQPSLSLCNFYAEKWAPARSIADLQNYVHTCLERN